jgi:hypothetical protein
MLQPVASRVPVTAPPICFAVRLMPSPTRPVVKHVDREVFRAHLQLVHVYAERGSPKYEKAALRLERCRIATVQATHFL